MRVAWPDLAAAIGLLLVIEGILPFLSPRAIRRAHRQANIQRGLTAMCRQGRPLT